MKTAKIMTLACITALFATAVSCSKDPKDNPTPEPTPDSELKAPVLALSAAEIALDAEAADTEALRLTWSAADADIAPAKASYKVYVNLASRDMFSSPVAVEAGGDLEYAFTNAALNSACTTLGATAEAQTELQFGVYASTADGKYEAVMSNIEKAKVTTYAEKFVGPRSLIMIGIATPWAWDLTKGLEIPATDEGSNVYIAENVPLTVLPESLNAGFKFYFSRGEQEGGDRRFAGQDRGSDVFGKITIQEGDVDFQFLPAAAGYDNGMYTVKVDFNAMMMTMERTGDLPATELPDRLYMLGDCFSWKWDWTGATLDKTADKVYKAENVVMDFGENGDNGFKVFLGEYKWSPYYAMTEDSTKDNIGIREIADSEAPQFYPGKLGYARGTYDIEMNFATMTLTLTDKGGDLPASPMTMLGTATPGGWDSRTLLPVKNDHEWEATGVALTLVDDYSSIKIFASEDGWLPWYGQAAGKDFGVLVKVESDEQSAALGDPQIYPFRSGYKSGTYTVNVNTETMRLTLTLEDGGKDLSTAMSALGTAMPGGWDTRTYLYKKSDVEWESDSVELTLVDDYSSIKIFASADGWLPWYGQAAGKDFGALVKVESDEQSAALGDPQIYPFRSGYTSGTYRIRLNTETMRLTLIKE